MATLTLHAMDRIVDRRIATDSEVLSAVERHEATISRMTRRNEVRVVVKTFSAKVSLPDGSNGDMVIACVDPMYMRVKTVMLQRRSQAERKAQNGDAPYIGL